MDIWVAKIRNDRELKNNLEIWLLTEENAYKERALEAHNIETVCLMRGRVEMIRMITQLLNQEERHA